MLGRLRTGWNESGLWNPSALLSADAAEVETLEDELYFRLRGVQRAALLRAGTLPAPQAQQLQDLCDSLAMGGLAATQRRPAKSPSCAGWCNK